MSVSDAVQGSEPWSIRKVLSWATDDFRRRGNPSARLDAELLLDGRATGPQGSGATLIPPAFGLAGVNLHTWTGWGSLTYWNAFVANVEMKGKGTFYDPIRGGECYKCEAGYSRSAAHITASNACYIPIHEIFSYAKRDNKGLAWDCSAGEFWDPIDGGYCFSCPSGYRRTTYHVSDAKACAQTVGEQTKHAVLVKKAACGPGEILDAYVAGEQNPSYGGGCWTCPAGTDRTIHPIYGEYGCERAPGVQWAAATRVRGMTCEPDQIFDPVSSGNSNVARALSERNAREPKIASRTGFV